MYVHPAFGIDVCEALPILRERGFGLFVLTTAGAPSAVHVPFLIDENSDGRLRATFHVARANPIHSGIGIGGTKALLVCQGPDAYISPDWYGIDNQVPTWTYVSVHLQGTARLGSPEKLLDHVDRLSARFEERLLPKPPWSSAKMDPAKRAAMLNAIVPIEFDVEALEAQKKLSQHKTSTARRGAIAGLRARGDGNSTAIAELMQQTIED